MKLVTVSNVKEGMILAKNIETTRGAIVIPKDTFIDSKVIDKIWKAGIAHVFIKSDEEGVDYSDYDTSNVPVSGNLYNTFQKLTTGFKDVFSNVRSSNKIEVKEINESLDVFVNDVLSSTNILDVISKMMIKDEYTFKHSVNVCAVSLTIGKWLKYPQDRLRKLGLAAILHDIGKAKIPSKILNKPDKLDPLEFNDMKKHAMYGYEIIKNTEELDHEIALGVLQHHEREDGSGYPLSVKGDKISVFGKIIAIADTFDAIISSNKFRVGESKFYAIEEIHKNSGIKLDPAICKVFIDNISAFFVGVRVRLSDDRVGEVIFIPQDNPTRPTIKVGESEYVDLKQDKSLRIVEQID